MRFDSFFEFTTMDECFAAVKQGLIDPLAFGIGQQILPEYIRRIFDFARFALDTKQVVHPTESDESVFPAFAFFTAVDKPFE